MYALRSLVRSAISILVFTRINFAIATLYKCILPEHSSMGNANGIRTDVYGSQLTVHVPENYGYAIYKYSETNTITFKVNEISVKFNETVVYTVHGQKKMPPKYVSQESQYRISGVAQHVEMNSTDSDISDCHIFLFPIGDDGHNVTIEMASEIRRLVESCVHTEICLQIGKMNAQYRMGLDHAKGLAQLPGLIGPNSYSESYFGPPPFQNAINTLINDGLLNFIVNIRRTQRETIYLPKIDSHFRDPKPYGTKGHLEALNGTLDSLTNVIRTAPPVLSHDGLKFTVSSTFALNLVKLSYNYRLKHSYKTSKGDLKALINAVNLEGRFAVDYNFVPCTTTLEHLKVTTFDEITTYLTGDALKTMDRPRDWFDTKILDGIARTIEHAFRYSAEIRLWNFDCERYRP